MKAQGQLWTVFYFEWWYASVLAESASVVHSECGYRCGCFPSSEKYKYCTKIMGEKGPHMWMKGTSETKIKLIVYLELFLATCALMGRMGESGTFMCEKLQGSSCLQQRACISYATSFASKWVEGQVFGSGVYPYRKQLSFWRWKPVQGPGN